MQHETASVELVYVASEEETEGSTVTTISPTTELPEELQDDPPWRAVLFLLEEAFPNDHGSGTMFVANANGGAVSFAFAKCLEMAAGRAANGFS